MKNITIIIPFYKKLEEFKIIFPLNYEILKKNPEVKELLIALDENESELELIDFLNQFDWQKYFFITLIVNDNKHGWRNPSKVINVGIKNATYENCLVLSPESLMQEDLIQELLANKERDNFVIGKLGIGKIRNGEADLLNIDNREKHYGSILFSKQHAINITGYNEIYKRWGYDDDDFRRRLEFSGINRKKINSGIIHFAIENKKDGVVRDNFNSRIFIRNNKIRVNGITWGTDFNRKVDLVKRNPNKITRPDVMHLSCYYGANHSIQKIVDNICSHNINHVLHNMNLENQQLNIDFINFIKPKILHLHFNSLVLPSLFSNLNYEPNAIIQTIHGDQKSNYSNYIDKVVTIFQKTYEENTESIYIENSINEIYKNINYDPQFNSCVTALRLNKINFEVFEKLEKINSNVEVFGYNYYTNRETIFNKYENIIFHYWNHFIEYNISKRKIFIYLIDAPELGYDMSVMEAAVIGMPIVALRQRQDGQQYIRDGYNGFIADSIDELIDHTNKLLSDNELYIKTVENASKHKNTLINNMPEKYNEVYQKYL